MIFGWTCQIRYGLVWPCMVGQNSEAACRFREVMCGFREVMCGFFRLSVWMGLRSGGWVGQMGG